jgi:hypothetical protein
MQIRLGVGSLLNTSGHEPAQRKITLPSAQEFN